MKRKILGLLLGLVLLSSARIAAQELEYFVYLPLVVGGSVETPRPTLTAMPTLRPTLTPSGEVNS